MARAVHKNLKKVRSVFLNLERREPIILYKNENIVISLFYTICIIRLYEKSDLNNISYGYAKPIIGDSFRWVL